MEIRGRTTQAKGTVRAKMLMWDRLLCLRNTEEAKVMMEEDRPGGSITRTHQAGSPRPRERCRLYPA